MYRENLCWLWLGGSIRSLQAPGQPPSPQPRWSSLEGHAAFLDSRMGTEHTACNITAWGGEFGKEGEGRGEQVAPALWRVHCTPPEKVHGLLVLKTYVLPRAKR